MISLTMNRIDFSNKILYLIPVIFIASCYNIYSQNGPIVACEPAECLIDSTNIKEDKCLGHVHIPVIAKDDHTLEDDLRWEYFIDLNNDGIGNYFGFDLYSTSQSKKQKVLGQLPSEFFNPFADQAQCSYNANGIYPIGIHKILFRVYDNDLNKGECVLVFKVSDCKPPKIKCKREKIEYYITSTSCVNISLHDLIEEASDNCSDTSNMIFFLNNDIKKNKLTLCCEDIISNGKEKCYEADVPIQVWLIDEVGNKSYCDLNVTIKDNLSICPISCPFGRISVIAKTIKNEIITPLNIGLFKKGEIIGEATVSPCQFNDLEFNHTYEVKVNKNDNFLNGVTTADIVQIQKHILGKSKIINPYILLAADVNKSCSITSADIAEIRRLILGSKSEFSKVPSWDFVPENYIFSDPNSPCKTPNVKIINISSTNLYQSTEFIGYKLGDVTGDARGSNYDALNNRQDILRTKLITKDLNFNKGELIHVSFKLTQPIDLEGLQFTLLFKSRTLQYIDYSSGKISLGEDYLGKENVNNGILRLSWDNVNGIFIQPEEELFSIQFLAQDDGALSDCLSLESSVSTNEAISPNGISALDLDIENQKLRRIHVYPNPVNDISFLNIQANSSEKVDLTIISLDGRNVLQFTKQITEGSNKIALSKTLFPNPGLYFLSIKFQDIEEMVKLVIY
ncbi:MAG: T9SS type A sorting domain-containing protein [Saprospiraceae bacterium]|nr:T9SS type A sorting domain-containing protein [Saprospiraceae bacterium]